jgi:hypothetical protein
VTRRRRTKQDRIVGWVAGLPLFAMFTSAFLTYFVWQDRPDAGDVGRHSLSGWLVETFGVHQARPVGTAIFAALTIILAMVSALALRWLRNLTHPGETNVGS